MIESPKSLTAIVHIKFHYEELGKQQNKLGGDELDMIGKLLERASTLGPDMQELLGKFADYLQKVGCKEDGQKGPGGQNPS